jgi:hypothetical protein
MDGSAYRLKITLRGSRPAIWRRIEVVPDITLFRLHQILQVVMGWTDSHLHQFRQGSVYYGQSDPEFGMHRENERRIRLRDVLRRPKDRMIYEYDFGDGWEHDIVLESTDATIDAMAEVCVMAGKRACPPEDVGGIGGYERFLKAIADPNDPEHDDMRDWGGPFDPENFEMDTINAYFRKRRRRNA